MLKTLVNQGVKLGFASLVEPNSISVDIKPIMIGALIDTNAIGVVKVKVRQTRRKNAMGKHKSTHKIDLFTYLC